MTVAEYLTMDFSFFREPFLDKGRIHKGLFALFIGINLLACLNALLQHPEIGYDANDHLLYMQVLSTRLPTSDDTREFFSPPLPYFLPSLVNTICLNGDASPTNEKDCRYAGGKFGQILNVLLSIGTTFFLIRIAQLWFPDNIQFRLLSLFFLGILPVYYKTFSQFWGQPYVAFFSTLAIWYFFSLIKASKQFSWKSGIKLGVIFGALILSRQWGFLVIATIACFVFGFTLIAKEKEVPVALLKVIAVSLVVSLMVGGWFYAYLYISKGSFMAFNRPSKGFSFSNKDISFYRNTGLKDFALFRSPVYGSFNDMFIPTFYSDVWGDYWGFYSLPNLTDKVLAIWDWNSTDYNRARDYLGRVNLVSLFPSLLMVLGGIVGIGSSLQAAQGKRRTGIYDLFLLCFLALSGFVYSLPMVRHFVSDV